MLSFLEKLADPAFMPHGHCYLWRADILWTHVISDSIIAISYLAIPVMLMLFLLKRKGEIPYPSIIGLFCAFIFLCGSTHFVEIIATWYPIYEYEGWIKALTALVSAFTACVLAPLLPELIALPDIKKSYAQANTALEELREKNQQLQSFYEVALEREERILSLKQEVNELLAQQQLPARYTTS